MRRLSVVLACVLGCWLFAAQGMGADVDVYAEGAYTSTDVAVYIYADINGPAILSYGVKLTYDPAVLTVTSAAKNEAVWYMGDGSANNAYMDPETGTAGEVVIIGGKLDTASPLAGVSGTRVLLGKVVFSRAESSTPFSSALGLTYGRMTTDNPPSLGAYKNFVAVDGTVKDGAGVAMETPVTHERGDANADGVINVNDMIGLREEIGKPDAPVWADCNGDEVVNVNDMICLRTKI